MSLQDMFFIFQQVVLQDSKGNSLSEEVLKVFYDKD